MARARGKESEERLAYKPEVPVSNIGVQQRAVGRRVKFKERPRAGLGSRRT